MGHDIIKCPKCGEWIMEGHNDWDCDECGWSSSEEQKEKNNEIRKAEK